MESGRPPETLRRVVRDDRTVGINPLVLVAPERDLGLLVAGKSSRGGDHRAPFGLVAIAPIREVIAGHFHGMGMAGGQKCTAKQERR